MGGCGRGRHTSQFLGSLPPRPRRPVYAFVSESVWQPCRRRTLWQCGSAGVCTYHFREWDGCLGWVTFLRIVNGTNFRAFKYKKQQKSLFRGANENFGESRPKSQTKLMEAMLSVENEYGEYLFPAENLRDFVFCFRIHPPILDRMVFGCVSGSGVR